ncbi:MAG: sigma-54-dependent transcriptional regulator, partial [Candidatus Binatia bacterium]
MPESAAAKILVLDDHTAVLEAVRSILEQPGIELRLCNRPEDALAVVGSDKIDLAISDVQMPGIDGFEFLERVRDIDPDVDVMLMTAYATVEGAVRSLHRGAVHYLVKPFNAADLQAVVHESLASRHRERHAPSAKFEAAVAPIVGRSLALLDILPQIGDYAEHSTTVLIHGETGCGKELIA